MAAEKLSFRETLNSVWFRTPVLTSAKYISVYLWCGRREISLKCDLLITGLAQTENLCVGERLGRSARTLARQKDNKEKELGPASSNHDCH